jgi:hypothetical protein
MPCRRSVDIVPATEHGVDQRFQKWLWFYDADVIYSYVS